MSLILGALGGAGGAMQDAGSAMLKNDLDTDRQLTVAKATSDLETQRQQALAQFNDQLKNAPLNRLSAKAQDFSQQQVPVAAAPVTSLTGDNPAPDGFVGPMSPGFVGDLAGAKSAVLSMPAGSDRDAALAQLQRQIGSDQDLNARAVAGKTRAMSSDEAMGAAVNDAKTHDLPAYAAYEATIGKPLRDERKLDLTAAREDNRMTLAAQQEQRRWEVEMSKLALSDQKDATNNKKIDALIDHWNNQDAAKLDPLGKAGTPERMTAVVNATNNTIRDLVANKPRPSDAAGMSQWQQQYDSARAVRDRAMQRLNNSFDDGTGAPSPMPDPSPAPAPAPAGGRPPLSNFMK